MSGDQLDLDAIESLARRGQVYDGNRLALALVAEVRRLRALVDAEPETSP